MELVYLWVEDYKNIKEQGFNFSSRFECTFYDEYEKDENGKEKLKADCKLEIEPKEHIENFFGDNINVTAIIGENGSGKSTILELLFNKYDRTTLEKGLFFIYFDKNTDKLIFLGANETKVNDSEYKIEMQSKMETLPSTKTVYFSNILNENDLFLPKYEGNIHPTHSVNISTAHRLSQMKLIETSSRESSSTSFDKIYRSYRIQQVLNALILIKDKAIEIPFDLPTSITLRNIDFRSYLTTIEDKFEDKHYREIVKILKNNNTDKGLFKNYLSVNLIISLMIENINSPFKERLLEDIHHKKVETSNLSDFYENVKERVRYNYISDANIYLPDINNFFKSADELIKKLTPFGLDETDNKFEIKLTIKDTDFSFLETYEKLIQQSEYFWDISFDRGLSSGEENFLYQFSRFYQLSKGFKDDSYVNLKINDNDVENIIFLIDEGEDTLHPRWQKKYIEYLTKFFRDNFEQNIHIIVTSHSPFIVSDLPKDNILFMKDGKEDKEVYKQTFGANIHTLLSDSFFMEDGLMGEFAKAKIEDVINFLQEKETTIKSHNEAKQIIDIIGEPVLQMRLEKMLDDYKLRKNIETEEDIEKQIKALQLKLQKKKNG